LIGSTVLRRLTAAGTPVRCLVRDPHHPSRVHPATALAAEAPAGSGLEVTTLVATTTPRGTDDARAPGVEPPTMDQVLGG
jgi:hypothetical protein